MEETPHVVVVDLGATNVRTGLIRGDGIVVSFMVETVPKNAGNDGSLVTERIAVMNAAMAEDTGITPDAIGISNAGPGDQKAEAVVGSPNMNCAQIILRGPLADRFGVPAFMLSDCKAGVLGEYFHGGAEKAHTVAYLSPFLAGIGCGVIANGTLLSSVDGNAGEGGTISVDSSYAVPCGCGGADHWGGSLR